MIISNSYLKTAMRILAYPALVALTLYANLGISLTIAAFIVLGVMIEMLLVSPRNCDAVANKNKKPYILIVILLAMSGLMLAEQGSVIEARKTEARQGE